MRPPRIARTVLWLLLPRSDRDELLADLDAEFSERARGSGSRRAKRWYRRQAAASASPLIALRWRRPDGADKETKGDPMDELRQDVRGALRLMRRRPLLHFAIAATLALGIGANTAIFSIVKTVLLAPLPFAQPDRLMRVWNRHDERGLLRVNASLQDLRDWRESAPSMASFAAWSPREGNFAAAAASERIDYALVSPDFARTLGVTPVLGRDFMEADNIPGSADVVIVSHGFWRDRLGGAASAIGATVRVDEVPMVVVGVMPPDFEFPQRGTALWKPFGMGPDDAGPRIGRWVDVVARLADGATIAQADAELAAIATRNAQAFPRSNEGWTTRLEPLSDALTRNVRGTLWIVWATIGLVLLICAANVTNLLLARALERRQEFAVRGALGAGRGRLMRQVLIESVVLTSAGALLGLLLAPAAVTVLGRFGDTALVSASSARIDGAVLLFTLALTMATGLLVGVLPAVRSGRTAVARTGRGVLAQGTRLRNALVTAEVALALTALIGAGLLVRSFAAVQAVDVGLQVDHRLTLRLSPPTAGVNRAAAAALWQRIDAAVAALPGVEAVGAVNRLPMEGRWWTSHIAVRGRAQDDGVGPSILHRVITPGYFDAAGIRLVRGRLPAAGDDAAATPVMAISESAARAIWGDDDPIGAVITNEDPRSPNAHWFTVVGIVTDAQYDAPDTAIPAASYTTLAQATWGHFGDWGMGLVVATATEPTSLLPSVRAAIAQVAPDIPVHDVQTMRGRIEAATAGRLSVTRSIGAFAVLAMMIAAIGTYAVLASNVARQVPEIGLRIALGASALSIAALILARGMRPVVIGVALGLAGGVLAGRLVQGMLFGVPAHDPLTFAGTAALLVVIALAAALVPAWRASRLSPREALAFD